MRLTAAIEGVDRGVAVIGLLLDPGGKRRPTGNAVEQSTADIGFISDAAEQIDIFQRPVLRPQEQIRFKARADVADEKAGVAAEAAADGVRCVERKAVDVLIIHTGKLLAARMEFHRDHAVRVNGSSDKFITCRQ